MVGNDYIEAVFCPRCFQSAGEEIEVDDYVKENCLFWCGRCRETLLCVTGYNSKNPTIRQITEAELSLDKEKDPCTQEISLSEALDLPYGHDLEKIIEESEKKGRVVWHFYLIGVLRITHLISWVDPSAKKQLRRAEKQKGNKKITKQEFKRILSESYRTVSSDPEDAVTCFDQLADIDTSHDGNRLYYRGVCTECNKFYESYIWGD